MRGTNYRKLTNKKLHEWMTENNLDGDYIIHHRDDTEECRKYNTEHYNMWGHNLDGSFEYGKYVVFMTRSEHVSHHHKNKVLSDVTKQKISQNHAKQHTKETKQKMSESRKGKVFSKEHKQKMSESCKQYMAEVKVLYANYKANGGSLSWNVFQRAIKTGIIPLEEHINEDTII